MGCFQSSCTSKVAFVSARLGKKTIVASFLSPAHTVRFNPRVSPSGSNTTGRLPRREEEARVGNGGAGGDECGGARWRPGGANSESSPASSSRTTRRNSAAGFSPVSALRSPVLYFFLLSGGRRGSRARVAVDAGAPTTGSGWGSG